MKKRSLLIAAYVIISAIVAFNPSIAKADFHVYDKNDQYLGIMVWMGGDDIDLFIPSLGGVFHYSTDYSGWCDDELRLVFVSSDCTGTPYARDPFPQIFDFSPLSPLSLNGFYKVDYNGKQTFTPGSRSDESCSCQPNPGDPNAEYYPFVQVQLPFTTPLALPLRFEVKNRAVVIPLN